jgi:hypothetical protein
MFGVGRKNACVVAEHDIAQQALEILVVVLTRRRCEGEDLPLRTVAGACHGVLTDRRQDSLDHHHVLGQRARLVSRERGH